MINTYVGLEKLLAPLAPAAVAAVNDGANELVARAQEYAPNKTGALAASIHTDGANLSGTGVEAHVQTGAEVSEYAIPVHEGSEPHIIEAKNGKALHFNGQFYRRVLHPGAAPNEYIEVPLLEIGPSFIAKCKAAMKAAY